MNPGTSDDGVARQWFYVDGQQRVGPVDEGVVLEIIRRLPDDQDIFVWRKGFDEWVTARSISHLLHGSVPPPIPPVAFTNRSGAIDLSSPSKTHPRDGEAPTEGRGIRAKAIASWTKTALVLAFSIAGMALAGSVGKDLGKVIFSSSSIAAVEEALNKGLPKMIDPVTRLERVTASRNAITYRYTLINAPSSDMSTFGRIEESLRTHIAKTACANPSIRRSFLENDIKMAHTYFSPNGGWLGAIEVSGADCKNVVSAP